MPDSVAILISDRNRDRRERVARLCEGEGYASTLVDTAEGALRALRADPGRFELVLVACAPGSFEAATLRDLGTAAKLVILTEAADNLAMLVEAYDIGAMGYLKLQMQPLAFLKSLELIRLGERLFPSRFVAFQARETLGPVSHGESSGALSPRETEILRLLSKGDSNRHIADQLAISEGTVKGHIRAITLKLGVPNRTKAAIWALEHGLRAARP